MKTSVLAVASLLGFATAFPHIQAEVENRRRQSASAVTPFPKIGGRPRLPGTIKFSEAQHVSTEGEHVWIAPQGDDQRGPCPGLNAAANHNYLPRNGIVTRETLTTGLWKAFGLGNDSTIFLQSTTAFFDGDSFSQKWSIGGYSDLTYFNNGTFKALGVESGICQLGHLKSEGDASITRGDWLAPADNDNCLSYPKFFQELLALGCKHNPTDCSIDMATLAEHQHNRKLHSIATNPNYFNPPFASIAFTPAAHHFVFALMANHTEQYPEGILLPSDLMDFFSYKYAADGKTLIYTPGYEKIPDDWYKRAFNDPWGLDDIVIAVTQQCAAYPQTCQIGGNQGAVNTYAGIDPSDISGGLFNSAALTDPYLLGCFLSQNIQSQAPDQFNVLLQGEQYQIALGLLRNDLAQGFGACNGLNAGQGPPGGNPQAKPMDSYAARFPGAGRQNYARAHPDRKFSPKPI